MCMITADHCTDACLAASVAIEQTLHCRVRWRETDSKMLTADIVCLLLSSLSTI